MLTVLRTEDDVRLHFSKRKVQNKRRIMKQKQSTPRNTGIGKEPTVYLSGGFGLSAETKQLSKDPIIIKFVHEKEAISYDKVWLVFANINWFIMYMIDIV